MADRTVRVRLRAEVTDFKRQMAEAGKATDATAHQFDRAGQKIQTTSGQMVRSAQVNREAWTTVGTALAATSLTVTALGAAVLKTGIEYNTLQQTSRAAMTTMLGGAEAANAQMDKLDEFARNSPFAKQVFIQAQRQMIGFGIETQKVLPYLDSIQNAVAAMGGSNHDISELSRIISQISASAKITAVDLREFGNRGVDAATIIGSQMGMTGAQIRQSITAGTLDAQEALDALATGMDEQFGGAAENVKNTYAGALDRVKAAWRDLASEIAAPLVDPNGGGMLVDIANQAADAMRAFQELPQPVKNATFAIGGLTASATGMGAAFLLLFPRVMDVVSGLATLRDNGSKVPAVLGRTAKAAGVATVAFLGTAAAIDAFNRSTLETATGEEAASALLDIANGATLADTALRSMVDRGGFGDWFNNNDIDSVASAFERITNAGVGDVAADAINKIGSLGSSMSASREQAGELFDSLDAGLASLVGSGALEEADQALSVLADDAGVSVNELLKLLPQYRGALASIDNEQRLAADSGDRLTEVQERVASAQEKVTATRAAFHEEVDRWRGVMSDAFTSFVDNQGAFDAAIQKQTEWAQAQAASTESAEDSWEDYYDGVTVSTRAYIDELQKQTEAQQEWADNVNTVSDRLEDSFSGDALANARRELDELASQGPASAGVISTLAGATDKELEEIVRLWGLGGEDAGRDFVNSFQDSSDPFIEPKLDMELAQITLDQWARQEVTLQVDIETTNKNWLQSNIDALKEGAASISGAMGGALAPGFAGGGAIRGPGTGTSDSVPILASDGEFMHRAAAHSFWGTRAMESINNNDVAGLMRELGARGFRDGGAISAPAPQVVTFPVEYRREEHAPQHFNIYGQSAFGDAMDFAEKRRQSVLGG